MLELEPVYLWIGSAAAVGIAGAVKWASTETAKQGIRGMKRKVFETLRKDVCAGEQAIAMVEAMRGDIAKILLEVKPNSGSSLKDAVNRTERLVEELHAELRHVRTSTELANDASGALLWRADALGRVIWVSRAIKEQMGHVDDSDYFGWGWLNMVHPDDRDQVRERWEQSVRDACDAQDEYRVVTRTGSVIHVKSHARPVFVAAKLNGWQGRHEILRTEEACR